MLDMQSIPCSHIYSALDQTARKINLGLFLHGKVRALLVTDVAARGIDIPMLDNVINYNFPPKAKLFLHRVGKDAIRSADEYTRNQVSSDKFRGY